MAESEAYDVARVATAPEPLIGGATYDYADSFAVRLAHPDRHTAAEWMRAALEQSAPWIRRGIRFVHRRVARFELTADADGLLGWRTVSSAPDALHIATEGRLLRAEIVARRTSDTTATLSTFLFYRARSAALLWVAVGPLHRRIAPYLLGRAASRLTRPTEPAGGPREA